MKFPLIRVGRASTPREILQRIALPFALFSFSLMTILALSEVAVLPRLTDIEFQGKGLTIPELRALQEHVKDEVNALEAARTELVFPLKPTLYGQLLRTGKSPVRETDLMRKIRGAALSVSPAPSTVEFSSFSFNGKSVEVIGDVRNVGMRSMTVLAQLTEAIGEISEIENVTPPPFTRERDPTIGFHSPFRLSLELR